MAKDCWNQPLFVKYITIFIHLFSVHTSLYHNGAKFQTCLVKRECTSKTKLSSAPLIENQTYCSKTTCAHIIWGKLSTPWILLVGCLPRSNSNHCVLYTELKKMQQIVALIVLPRLPHVFRVILIKYNSTSSTWQNFKVFGFSDQVRLYWSMLYYCVNMIPSLWLQLWICSALIRHVLIMNAWIACLKTASTTNSLCPWKSNF